MQTQVFKQSDAEYFADTSRVSCSNLKDILKAPAVFKYKIDHPEEAETTAELRFGKLFHLAILEPDLFRETIAIWDESQGSTKTKAYQEFVSRLAPNVLAITTLELMHLEEMKIALMNNREAWALIHEGVTLKENTFHWDEAVFGRRCRAKMDCVNLTKGIIVDLKTTKDASPEGFGKAIEDYKYHMQAAFYLDAARTCLDDNGTKDWNFVCVAIEKNPPYLNAIYSLTPNLIFRQLATEKDYRRVKELETAILDLTQQLSDGNAMVNLALQSYMASKASDVWEGYARGVSFAKRPRWAKKFTEFGR